MDKTLTHYYRKNGAVVIAAAAWTDDDAVFAEERRKIETYPPVFIAKGCYRSIVAEGLPVSKPGYEYGIEWRVKDAVLSGGFVITASLSAKPEITQTHNVSLAARFFTMQPLPSDIQLGTPLAVKIENTFTYPYYTIDWGDSAVTANTAESSLSHTYTSAGEYTITATLVLAEQTHSVSHTVKVHTHYSPPLRFKHIYKTLNTRTLTAFAWNSSESKSVQEVRTPSGAGVPAVKITAPAQWGSEIPLTLNIETNDGSTFDIDFGDGIVLREIESGSLTHIYSVWQSVRKKRLLYRIKDLEANQEYDVRCRAFIGSYTTEYYTQYATTIDYYVPTTFTAYLQINDFPNTRQDYPYNIDIDWGDGTDIEHHQSVDPEVPQYSHTYTLTQDVSAAVTITTVCGTAQASQTITAFWCPDYWYAVPFELETDDPNFELNGVFNIENTEIIDEFAVFDMRFDISGNKPFYHYETTYAAIPVQPLVYELLTDDSYAGITLPQNPFTIILPKNKYIQTGTEDSVSVLVTGATGQLTYQWYSNSSASNTGGTIHPCTSPVLPLLGGAIGDISYYYCDITSTTEDNSVLTQTSDAVAVYSVAEFSDYTIAAVNDAAADTAVLTFTFDKEVALQKEDISLYLRINSGTFEERTIAVAAESISGSGKVWQVSIFPPYSGTLLVSIDNIGVVSSVKEVEVSAVPDYALLPCGQGYDYQVTNQSVSLHGFGYSYKTPQFSNGITLYGSSLYTGGGNKTFVDEYGSNSGYSLGWILAACPSASGESKCTMGNGSYSGDIAFAGVSRRITAVEVINYNEIYQGQPYQNRNLKKFNLYGAMTGAANWTQLGTFTMPDNLGGTDIGGGNYRTVFTFDNKVKYDDYRVQITENYGQNMLVLWRIRLCRSQDTLLM